MGIKANPTIVVLGAKGLLGQAVYSLLKKRYLRTVYGTDRHDKNMQKFEAEDTEKSFGRIQRKVGQIDFVINCIGLLDPKTVLLNEDETAKYIQVNTVFPHTLSQLARTHGFRLIHLSTDAVFDVMTTRADEHTQPSPVGIYALTKLLGEPQSKNAITFRTSIIGKDQFGHKGLVEWVLGYKANAIGGFIDQRWSGCTTLQFAQLCEQIIENDLFSALRKKSPVFHFAPIGPVTKYAIVAAVARKGLAVQKKYGGKTIRVLTSAFAHQSPFSAFYKNTFKNAVSEMLGV